MTREIKRVTCATKNCATIIEISGARHKYCDDCAKKRGVEAVRRWKKLNPARTLFLQRRWRERNRDKVTQYNRSYQRKRRLAKKVKEKLQDV